MACASGCVLCSYRLVSFQPLVTPQLANSAAFAAVSASSVGFRFASLSSSSRSCVQHFSENFLSWKDGACGLDVGHDARLQPALDRVPGQIIRPGRPPASQQARRVEKAVLGKLPQLGPIHSTALRLQADEPNFHLTAVQPERTAAHGDRGCSLR
jgi:hypothetical protein